MSNMYRIVETDNFGGDYPDEKFVNLPPSPNRQVMHALAEVINAEFCHDEAGSRFWKVVLMPYTLVGGFTP